MSEIRWLRAAARDELREGDANAVTVDGRALALYVVSADEIYASDDRCTHGDARLSEGFLIDYCIECPLHQGQFDVRDGRPLCEPVDEPIRIYPVRVSGGDVEVGLSD